MLSPEEEEERNECETSHIPIHIAVVVAVVFVYERKSETNRHKTPKGNQYEGNKKVYFICIYECMYPLGGSDSSNTAKFIPLYIGTFVVFVSQSQFVLSVLCVCARLYVIFSHSHANEIRQILDVAKQQQQQQTASRLRA